MSFTTRTSRVVLSIWGADIFSRGVQAGQPSSQCYRTNRGGISKRPPCFRRRLDDRRFCLSLQGEVKQSKNPSPPGGLGLMGGLFGRLPTRHCVTSRRKNAALAIWFRPCVHGLSMRASICLRWLGYAPAVNLCRRARLICWRLLPVVGGHAASDRYRVIVGHRPAGPGAGAAPGVLCRCVDGGAGPRGRDALFRQRQFRRSPDRRL